MGEDRFDRRAGWQRLVTKKISIIVCALTATAASSQACVGTECMNIWSTEDGAGNSTMDWDFTQRKVQTFQRVCAGGTSPRPIEPPHRAVEGSATARSSCRSNQL